MYSFQVTGVEVRSSVPIVPCSVPIPVRICTDIVLLIPNILSVDRQTDLFENTVVVRVD
jgi:hypothetical protein